ncbi:MAG: PAS domain-containing protein [Firmicutes bacterium]|nr:PAS domain-containing protein [Bacillota bacterium]
MSKKKALPRAERLTVDEFFQSLPVPVFLLNENRRVEKMTPAAAAIFSGFSTAAGGDECTFGRVVNCIHSLDDPRGCGQTPSCEECPVRATILEIYATGQPCRQKEVKLTLGPDGHDCYLVISAELLALPSGCKILLHFEDITARKKAEEKLALTKDILDRAQKVARVGSWNLDLATNIMLWTDETYRIFGLQPGTPVNYDRFLQKIHPGDREYVERKWRAALAGKPYEIEHRIIVNGQVKWVREKAEVETDKRGNPLRAIGTVQDITVYKQQETDKARLQRELLHVSRVTAMGELTAALAHELNQPLMAIMGNVQAAQRFLTPATHGQDPDYEEIREILADVVEDSKRAAETIRKIRVYLKKSLHKPAPLDLNTAIREILPLIRSNAVIKNISLKIELAPDLPPVKGDRVQLQQVIVNLVLNGFEAMTGEGEKELTIRTAGDGKTVAVSAIDTGTGIAVDNPEDLFRPFFTTKNAGMGMGLAVSKSIIEAHGGSLKVENNRGGPGAAFSFILPVYEGD